MKCLTRIRRHRGIAKWGKHTLIGSNLDIEIISVNQTRGSSRQVKEIMMQITDILREILQDPEGPQIRITLHSNKENHFEENKGEKNSKLQGFANADKSRCSSLAWFKTLSYKATIYKQMLEPKQ